MQGNGVLARVANLEGRVDRFETRVERELSQGSRTFVRREVFDALERELRSDVNDLRVELRAFRAEEKEYHAEQRSNYKAIRNLVLSALLSAIASGVVSFGVWTAQT